jgi:ribosomal-protein-alanine N-acetyltransferase
MTLHLTPLTAELAAAVSTGEPAPWADAPNAASVAETVQDVAAAQAALYGKTGAAPPWIGYLAQDPADMSLVGVGSFVAAPKDGQVEIAYFTFPGGEGRGCGGRMAKYLVDLAFEQAEVKAVIAHTLPEENPSARILRRRGFDLIGPIDHPEDGTVWLWRLTPEQRL